MIRPSQPLVFVLAGTLDIVYACGFWPEGRYPGAANVVFVGIPIAIFARCAVDRCSLGGGFEKAEADRPNM
jgi:hypothetical protein